MNNIKSILIAVAISVISCKSSNKTSNFVTSSAHNTMNSTDWFGTYKGIIPCGDCEGIETVIKLKKELTYTLLTKYKGKSEEVITKKGSFAWNKDGTVISLESDNNSSLKFKVEENRLLQLDMKGNKISGNLAKHYILSKVDDNITSKYWKLTELNGVSISYDKNKMKEVYLKLIDVDKRIVGSGGCNNFTGSYELGSGFRIKFSKIATTQMACFKYLKLYHIFF